MIENFIKALCFFIALMAPAAMLADMAPKYSEKSSIYLEEDYGRTVLADSISAFCVIRSNEYIANLHHNTAEFWTRPTLHMEDDHYDLICHSHFKSFRLVLFYKGMRLESENLSHHYANSEYRFKIAEGKLMEVSSLFRQSWKTYFTALSITLLVEILIGLLFYYFRNNGIGIRYWLRTVVAMNLASHVLLWAVYCNSDVSIFFLEVIVWIAEAYVFKRYLGNSTARAIGMSIIANMLSFAIGFLVNY